MERVINLKDLEITPVTHPLLIQLSHCYQAHTMIPSRQEMLAANYEMPQVDGHCTLKGLVVQAGYDLDKELAKAQACMDRAMEKDTND